MSARTHLPGKRRRSIRTQLIAWNALALALMMGVLGAVVRVSVVATLYASIDRDLRRRIEPPPHPHGPPGPGGPGNAGGPPPFPGPPGFRPDSNHGPDGFGPGNDVRDRGDGPAGQGAPGPPDQPGGPDTLPEGIRDPGLGVRDTPGLFPRSPHMHFPHESDPLGPHRYNPSGQLLWPPDGQSSMDVGGLREALNGDEAIRTVTVAGTPYRVISTPQGPPREPLIVVQAAYPLADVNRTIADLDRVLLMLAPVSILCAALGGSLLTNRVLRRVKVVASAAAGMNADRLEQRLPVEGDDEFAALAETFNTMLDRLDRAFRQQERVIAQQRQFTADASHELKSPLTVIKGTAGFALSGNHTESDYRDALQEIDSAADTMSSLVQDLLLLARSDAGQLAKDRIELLVSDLVQRARGSRRSGAPISIETSHPNLAVRGNEQELIRVFSNLLDNAVRHTPENGAIVVRCGLQTGSAIIDVADTGSGIAAEHLPHLGERFYRIDSARARHDGGSGLGLSICRSIVEAHGGHIAFSSTIGIGTTVRIVIPAA